jgi:hypothetical protein
MFKRAFDLCASPDAGRVGALLAALPTPVALLLEAALRAAWPGDALAEDHVRNASNVSAAQACGVPAGRLPSAARRSAPARVVSGLPRPVAVR